MKQWRLSRIPGESIINKLMIYTRKKTILEIIAVVIWGGTATSLSGSGREGSAGRALPPAMLCHLTPLWRGSRCQQPLPRYKSVEIIVENYWIERQNLFLQIADFLKSALELTPESFNGRDKHSL